MYFHNACAPYSHHIIVFLSCLINANVECVHSQLYDYETHGTIQRYTTHTFFFFKTLPFQTGTIFIDIVVYCELIKSYAF